jgi:type III restriction enzyme
MVSTSINIKLFDFQEEAVIYLVDLTTGNHKQTVIVKSPTGSGKTIILINYICEYLDKISRDTAFIWLCPGKGDLEEQSRKKMLKFAPTKNAQTLQDALSSGFTSESTTFINWEMVTKSGNRAISDSERKNLFDRIAEAHSKQIKFIIVVDEEHSNNTAKANKIIEAFSAAHILRMSATATKNNRFEYYEIDETEVINAGLITKALYVNEDVENGELIDNDYDHLIELADKKRKDIANRYIKLGKTIRPLVLIQFPNGQPETIKAVEDKLESMGYTFNNGFVSKWMSEEKKDLPANLTENDATPVFLLMKQAISTGWDCPRAKILVKLREGMNEQFEIQTIGRIRRMPEASHYDDDLLDFCFVYTYDEQWKNGLLQQTDKAYETKRLFLKEKCKTFELEKQLRDKDISMMGTKEVMIKVHNHFVAKFKLTNDKKQNKTLLEEAGYIFGASLIGTTIQGKFVHTEAVGKETTNTIQTKSKVDTHKHGIYLLHSTDEVKKAVGLSTSETKVVLERLFRKDNKQNNKLINLETAEFYAFVINNEKKLKEDFREIGAKMVQQIPVKMFKTAPFRIPVEDFFKFDLSAKTVIDFLSNAYEGYTSEFNTKLIRSTSEQLFEQYCEKNNAFDWVYKNGDTGQQYFSIVYVDGFNKQWLFYPDYVVKMKNGNVWIIETKGGETAGVNKNIDLQIENKFNAFKNYANYKNLKWGFVRDVDNLLYINYTDFVMDMSDSHWKPIEDDFK